MTLPHWKTWLLWLIPLLLLGVYWLGHPFSQTLSSRSIPLQHLSFVQRENIRLAAQTLDNTIIPPGKMFSFNQTVGPRTLARGYQPAPSYVGPDSPATLGGGICLLSSALYQSALYGGLTIAERVPHLRTIGSVLPGLDAAVWYGQADLRFRNAYNSPVMIRVTQTEHNINVALLGKAATGLPVIRRIASQPNPDQVQVNVFRQVKGQSRLVSRDVYRRSP